MSATINTFPPFQSMNSPRGWILATIVLLHVGFIALLSSGMGPTLANAFKPRTTYVDLPREPKPVDPEPPSPERPIIDGERFDLRVPAPDFPRVQEDDDVITGRTFDPQRDGSTIAEPPVPRTAVIVGPEIDTKHGLSEPLYPASEIRMEHTGTVLLSVYVLENGRIGDVRLDVSSGWPKLDDSAMREARRWRLKPGMRDGVAVPMWKQIPITFQLQEGVRR